MPRGLAPPVSPRSRSSLMDPTKTCTQRSQRWSRRLTHRQAFPNIDANGRGIERLRRADETAPRTARGRAARYRRDHQDFGERARGARAERHLEAPRRHFLAWLRPRLRRADRRRPGEGLREFIARFPHDSVTDGSPYVTTHEVDTDPPSHAGRLVLIVVPILVAAVALVVWAIMSRS